MLHEKVHSVEGESRGDIRIARGLRLRSLSLGLIGAADAVEFHRVEVGGGIGAGLHGIKGRWLPQPVEYKRGRPKPGPWDEVQVCAQALCLEEMLGLEIPRGAIFYGRPRRRLQVEFDLTLRTLTRDSIRRMHELYELARTPAAQYDKKCQSCSLMDACRPKSAGAGRSARQYLERVLSEETQS